MMYKPTKFDRKMGALMPLVFPKNALQALLYIALALALIPVMKASGSLWFQAPVFFVVCGLAAPGINFIFMKAAQIDAYIVRKSQGEELDKPQSRWNGIDNKKGK